MTTLAQFVYLGYVLIPQVNSGLPEINELFSLLSGVTHWYSLHADKSPAA